MAADIRTLDTTLITDDLQPGTTWRRTSVEIERRGSFSRVEDAEVDSHCNDLEACLASLSARQSPARTEFSSETVEMLRERLGRGVPDLSSRFNVVETNVRDDARLIEVQRLKVVPRVQVQEIVRSKPVVEIQQQIRTVPRLEVKEVERVVEVPHTHYVNRLVEVPEVRVVEEVVEVPQVCIQEVVKEVPRVQVHEVIRHVPRVEVREVLRAIPKVEVKVVEKIVEVPQIRTIEKIVEVPEIRTVEKTVEVPQVQVVEKIVPIEKIIQVERPVYVTEKVVVPVEKKIEVLECVVVNGMQVPFMSEIMLTSMTPTKLREHAFFLYNTFGQSGIISSPPSTQAELVRWVVNAQRQHLEPFRAKAAPLAGYQPFGTQTASVTSPLGAPRASVTSTTTTNAAWLTPRASDGIPNFQGVPESLQSPRSFNGGSLTVRVPRQEPERIVAGTFPYGKQRSVTIASNASEMGFNSLGKTQLIDTTSSIATGGSLAAPVVMGSASPMTPSLGVTVPGLTGISQSPKVGSITAPICAPRTEVQVRNQTPVRYRSAVAPSVRSASFSQYGSSSALLSNGLVKP